MAHPLQIRVSENKQLLYTVDLAGPVELGRQSKGEEGPYSQTRSKSGRARLVIASIEDQTISRQHVLLESAATGGCRLENLSDARPIGLPDGTELKPKTSCHISLPVVLKIGKKAVRVQEVEAPEVQLQGLAEATRAPGTLLAQAARFPTLAAPAGTNLDHQALVRWLWTVMDVLQSAATASDCMHKAAQAVVDLVGLDTGRVLLFEQGDWQTAALRAPARLVPETDKPPSRGVLNRVRQEKRTFWEVPKATAPEGSLVGVQTVVAAPILDRHGAVVGALYGDRRKEGSAEGASPITELEAMLVELLAGGIAAQLARLELEKAVLTARVQFEQFFTPELSRHLEASPDLLQGRDAEVSILFCDIRSFSRISERLGPAATVEWISAVMGALSDCVRAHQGVLVDYIGDELMAMWGAPETQPDHARLACRAALDMLDRLPALNEQWQAKLQEPLRIGIGINTGMARVGNTGSQHKFKYGPLGNTVNLASRVQGATKYLQSRLLITGATQAKLNAGFGTRRLCRVRVVNIAEPVALYELVGPSDPGWSTLQQEYEKALAAFERKDFNAASRILGNLRGAYPDDGPALVLLSRAVNALVEKSPEFDPVWELPGK